MNFATLDSVTATLAARAAAGIRRGFADYHARFRALTQRAPQRFAQRDWVGMRGDLVERIELYDVCVAEMHQWLEAELGLRSIEHALWRAIRDAYAAGIAPLLDQEMYKTYYNTLTRRFFRTRGVDPQIEFVALDIEPTDRIAHPVARHSYSVFGDLGAVFRRVLESYRFARPYADSARCAQAIARTVEAQLGGWGSPPVALELLETVFYREQRAYLVGRVFGEREHAPLVIALENADDGIRADAVLTERDHVSAQVFGYHPQLFPGGSGTWAMPWCSCAPCCRRSRSTSSTPCSAAPSRARPSATAISIRHLEHRTSSSCWPMASAAWSWLVFTLPSYPLVFKLIRDRFAPPKTRSREDVIDAAYQFVFKHDRAGRLIDAQEFRFLRFRQAPVFAGGARRAARRTAARACIEDGEDLVIVHCYIERRLRPLNLYLRESGRRPVPMRAVLDYGQAIRDLARSNIFPGDLLLKNFGVTRTARDLLRLRRILPGDRMPLPPPAHRHHRRRRHASRRLVSRQRQRRVPGTVLRTHGEIFDVRWWLALQEDLARGAQFDVSPYPAATRLATG
jgi:isocitrate dehydrogenase kinase/phosphatase